jgi:hypothetical protein
LNLKNGDCKHVVLFGTFNENKYFLGDYRDKFDLIGFNANIIAHAPDGIAAFISRLTNKAFFIDPQTHAFQQPIHTIKVRRNKSDKWKVKKSIATLANYYGSIIRENVGSEQLKAGSLKDKEIVEICGNTLSFQQNLIQKSAEKLDVKEFLEFSEVELRPVFFIAPYFYLEPDKLDEELEDNISFITESKNSLDKDIFLSSKAVFAEIVLNQELLYDVNSTEKILKKYTDCAADGFLVWINDFSEVSVSGSALKKYKEFLYELGKQGQPIIALHGSYYSIALSGKKGILAGVGHGIEYGESRPVVPVGGGVPLAKFYFPKFHKRIDYSPDAQNILTEKEWHLTPRMYFDNVCSCEMCRKIIQEDVEQGFEEYGETKKSEKNSRLYPTPEAMDKSRRHYLNTKINEYHRCTSVSISEIISELQNSHTIAERISSHPFTHLQRWADVLST